jgi:hypothetical protein
MIRFSVGIENIRDIKADFKQALEHLSGPGDILKVNNERAKLQREINFSLYGF